MTITSLTSIVFFALVLYFVLKRLLRRKKKQAVVRRDRNEIERWLDDALARELHRKLGLDRDLLQRALEGTPEPEAVGAMEEAVKAMQATYAWRPEGSVEVRLDVTFEDGTSANTSRIFPRNAMPVAVREEFTSTGASTVLRAVYFPWSTPS
ncbi:hypothetical protein [Chondromyces crocatus]|uniref:Uncharacterized protein n=1 Tax=Chondromyces crocatus TaxID=52 RepID=A0A0K1ECJ2_CHOCO|nr:hypothetical protein [Chondromyces crocatus]AKT38303.1 uncharacterized protein CMC5_024480 [Chondromyces crocatus]